MSITNINVFSAKNLLVPYGILMFAFYGLAAIPEMGEELEKNKKNLKKDFFKHRVFVFTPNGDVIDLPADSSPIDFAYAIHSGMGDTLSGAKVNQKIVSLDYAIRNGDVVDIMTEKEEEISK